MDSINIGININDSTQPFTEQILNGEKTIETRDSINNALQSYIGQRVGIVRTGVGNTKVVGYATIGEPIHYTSEEQFRKDEDKHLVKKGSSFDIKKEKYGYPLLDVEPCEPFTPYKVSIKTSILREPKTFREFYELSLLSGVCL